MNNVVLVGNLTRDPELSYTANTQTAVCRFSIAVQKPRRNGEDMGADFFRITVWGKQAENCDRYLSKGRKVAVNGRIETGSYVNKEGITVNTVDIIASNVEFLSPSNSNSSSNAGSFNTNNYESNDSAPEKDESDAFETVDDNSLDGAPDSFQAAVDELPF